MTNDLQSNIIEKERMFDKATGKFNYICGDGTMEMINIDEVIALKTENKNLKKENSELKEENKFIKKQLKNIEEYSNSIISLIS